jgi:N-acetylglucosaminyl-diphospho-decaprenol L-rhamnosyltransferase
VVVAHARLDLAAACVRSLRRWLDRERIVIVLNMPAAVEQSLRAELAVNARVISPRTPQGYGANLNLGERELGDGPAFCLCANDDVVFARDSLPRLADCLRTDPTVGVAGPQLVYPDGAKAASAGGFPRISDLLLAGLTLPGPLWRWRERRARAMERETVSPGPVDFVFGAAMLVRREAFAAVRGFDERFFLNWEEVDLCFRLRQCGWGVVWCADAEVVHAQGSSIPRPLNFATFYSSERLYVARRLGRVRWALLEPLLGALFLLGVAYDLANALLRPRTTRRRVEEMRQRWRTRLFLRRRLDEARSPHAEGG